MMLLWPFIVLLLAATLVALLFPLFRGRDTLETRDAFDANIFKDQLKTIDRELDEGQIEAEDAEAARLEISRKLLAAADKAEQQPSMKAAGRQMSRSTAITLALIVPLMAVGLYLKVGSPHLEDLPLETRARVAPVPKNKIAELIARAEQRLASKPDDGKGWEIMAPIYLRHEMFGKAESAYKNAIRLLGSNATRLSGLADSIILANDGIVSDEVLPTLKRAIKADANHPKPHFWMGLYYEQNSKFKQAEDLYTTLLEKSGAQVPWRATVVERLNEVRKKQGLPSTKIAGVKSTPVPEIKLGDALKADVGTSTAGKSPSSAGKPMSGPTADQVKQAGQMSVTDRQEMINNMVSRLSTRLYEEGGDINSWMRLVNVLNVQGKKDEAQKAVLAGKKNLSKDAQAMAQLDALAKRLGLGS
jgi:cytochrome c-type biogenesis protein CcmH